jgi:hypothetical protein
VSEESARKAAEQIARELDESQCDTQEENLTTPKRQPREDDELFDFEELGRAVSHAIEKYKKGFPSFSGSPLPGVSHVADIVIDDFIWQIKKRLRLGDEINFTHRI